MQAQALNSGSVKLRWLVRWAVVRQPGFVSFFYKYYKVWWHAATLFIYFYINRGDIQYFFIYCTTRRAPLVSCPALSLTLSPFLSSLSLTLFSLCEAGTWSSIIAGRWGKGRTQIIGQPTSVLLYLLLSLLL
jgi:hypothetical protein